MGEFDEVNSMKRMMGLKGPKKKQIENRARKRRLIPLKEDAIEDIESSVGMAPGDTDERRRRRRRRGAPVLETILGSSAGDRLGG